MVVVISVVLGLAGAFMLVRLQLRAKSLLYAVLVSPILAPGIVLGISAFIFWSQRLGFRADWWTAALAQCSFIAAYCMLIFVARLQRFDTTLEEAGLDLGATPRQVFWRITLPYLRPAMLSAAALAFLQSFENFTTTYFAIGAEQTFTIFIANKVRQGVTPAVNAVAFIIVAVTVLVAVVVEVRRRRAAARGRGGGEAGPDRRCRAGFGAASRRRRSPAGQELNSRKRRHDQDDCQRGVRRDPGRAGRHPRLRHRRLGLHGRARPVPGRRHPLRLGGPRAGRRPHGRRLLAGRHGRHGVCIAQNGPGITNFVTAIAAAYWAHSPVVVITPETGSNTQGLGGFQETEQLPFFEKITKYQAHCPQRARIAELLSRCFDYAMLERGPAQFNIPRDLFYGEADVTIPRRSGSSAAPAARRASPPPPSCWPARVSR